MTSENDTAPQDPEIIDVSLRESFRHHNLCKRNETAGNDLRQIHPKQ